MAHVLFAPLNTNHVRIFAPVAAALRSPWIFLCHDRVSESARYHTGAVLRELGLASTDFPEAVPRDRESFPRRMQAARRIARGVVAVLDRERPGVLVLGIDHDPIAVLLIRAARRRGARIVVIQEGLIRPGDLEDGRGTLTRLVGAAAAAVGAPVGYARFASQPVDAYLLSGERARQVLERHGVRRERLVLVGQPKYDAFIRRAGGTAREPNPVPTLLFAAPAGLLRMPGGGGLLRALATEAGRTGVKIVVKLHPRGDDTPDRVRAAAGEEAPASLEVVTGGDDAIGLLQRMDGFITVSSTMVLEALLLERECVVLDYLAGKASLAYGPYGAVHLVGREEDLGSALRAAIAAPTPASAKRRLLEDELYRLDGRAAERAAAFLEAP